MMSVVLATVALLVCEDRCREGHRQQPALDLDLLPPTPSTSTPPRTLPRPTSSPTRRWTDMSTSSLARIWGLALARIGRPATRGRLLLPPAPRRASSGRPTAALSPPSYFRILALESSADDTGAACVDSNRRILSNVVLKQHEIHGASRPGRATWLRRA